MFKSIIVAALSATTHAVNLGSASLDESARIAPIDSQSTTTTAATSLACGDCTKFSVVNMISTITDGSINVTFDAPSPDDGSAVTSYMVAIKGQGVDTEVECTASPCNVEGLALVSGSTYEVIVNPVFEISKKVVESFSIPWYAQTSSVHNCPSVADASQQLLDAMLAHDKDASLVAMECPVDLVSPPLLKAFWGNWSPLLYAARPEISVEVFQRLLDIGADPMEG